VETLLWYKSQQELRDKAHVQSLATYFCSRIQAEFNPAPLLSLRTSPWNDDASLYPVAKAILSGEAEWLEEGIIRCGSIEEHVADGGKGLVCR
ncbi:MAG: hypothetical protein ACXWWJ_08880, partial [Nitrospira sp.]